MLQLNLTDETNFAELVSMLLSGQQDEIILQKDDTRSIKMVLEDDAITKKRQSMFGIIKDKYEFPPDFDEKFVAMDAEILADFSDDPECEF